MGSKGDEGGRVVLAARQQDVTTIPRMAFGDYLISKLKNVAEKHADKYHTVDVNGGTSVKFRDLEPQSRKIASFLVKRGFKRRDTLYFATYELAQLSVVHLAVWRMGGVVRGCYQGMPPAEYARQIRETESRFLLVDVETAPLFREAAGMLAWPVEMISVGKQPVQGATSFQDMLQDDGSACPEQIGSVDVEDPAFICNTSGSTGLPKGVIHSHFSAVAYACAAELTLPTSSMIHSMMSNGVGSLGYMVQGFCTGLTVYYVAKFSRETFFDIIMQYKPATYLLYPYIATWFARCENELARLREADFARCILVSGWMMDATTNALLEKQLPNTSIKQIYASSECAMLSCSQDTPGKVSRLKVTKDAAGQPLFSNGNLVPFAEGKVIDPGTGATLDRGEEGEILFRVPFMMTGYLELGKPPNREPIDSEGWYHSGDLGFFDSEGHMYVKERLVFTYKYCMQRISPAEIESVIAEHPAVLAAGVVGLPNPETDCVTRAFVSLRAGCQATEQEIVDFVASKVPKHKQIHAGVVFLDTLPVNRALKLDRVALRQMASDSK